MLEILSSKGSFDLNPEQSIDWEELFHATTSNGDLKSWRFSLPKSPHNMRMIDALVDIDAPRMAEVQIEVQIVLFGQDWSEGPLWFIDEDADNYEVSFAGKLGYLLQLIEDRSLRDFSYPDPSPVDIYSHAEAVMLDPDSYDYVFAPVDLPSLNGEKFWPPQANAVVVNSSGNFDRFAEFFRTFEAEEWNENETYISGALVRFNKLYYEATAATNTGESPLSHPAKWNQSTLGNRLIYVPIVPFVKVLSALRIALAEVGVSLSGELVNNAEIQNLVFFNTQCLNVVNDDGEIGTVNGSTPISYANHVPDVPVVDVLRALGDWFCQRFDYRINDATLLLTHRPDYLKRRVNTSLRDSLIRMEVLHKEKRTYNLRYNYSQADEALQDDSWNETLSGRDDEEGSVTVNSAFSSLPMRYGFREVDPNWTEYTGDTAMDANFPGEWWRPVSALPLNAEVPQQFLFYRGLHVYQNGSWVNDPELPQLSSDLNFTNTENWQYTALWTGPNGLYEKWWRYWLSPLSLAKVIRLYLLVNGADWRRDVLLNPQAIREWLFLFEKAEFSTKPRDTGVLIEVEAVRL